MNYTLTQDGRLLTETLEGVTMPADYSFSTVNDYVHSPDRTYEELECLCLGMACHIGKISQQRDGLMKAMRIIAGANECVGSTVPLINIAKAAIDSAKSDCLSQSAENETQASLTLADDTQTGVPAIIFSVEVTPQEAWDYAQFLKRAGFSDYRNNAVDQDEAYRMLAVGEKIRKTLAYAGYAPR